MKMLLAHPVVASLTVALPALAQPIGFHVLEPLPGHTTTLIYDFATNGTVGVGGSSNSATGAVNAVRVDAWGVPVVCPTTPIQTRPAHISGDGRFGAGTGLEGDVFEYEYSYRRDGCGPEERLTNLQSRVGGINGDGSVVVGGQQFLIQPWVSRYAASRWTAAGGFQTLISPDDPDIALSFASGVSADGNIVCGTYIRAATELQEAFIWTPEQGLRALPRPTSRLEVGANAISSDGQRIVGFALYDEGYRNIMWVGDQILDLGPQTSATGTPNAVSNTGLVVSDFREIRQNATVWTPELGQQVPLPQYIESFGIDVPNGWILFDAVAVSDDGRTIAGSAYLPNGTARGFVVTVPSAGAWPLLFLAGLFGRGRSRRT